LKAEDMEKGSEIIDLTKQKPRKRKPRKKKMSGELVLPPEEWHIGYVIGLKLLGREGALQFVHYLEALQAYYDAKRANNHDTQRAAE
jgi:hypothetical protein